MEIKLLPPIEHFSWRSSVSQMFGVSPELYRRDFDIPAHNALDIVIKDNTTQGFGATIYSMHAGTIENIAYDVPHKTKGNGIYILSEDKTYSTNYWHLASFLVQIGEKVKAWQPIATMGNSGRVFPTPSPACPRCGTHAHTGLRIHGKQNEYNGFVDPTPYLWREGQKLPIKFTRNLFVGSSGDQVSWLQTILKIELKHEVDFEPIAYFGNQTRKAVSLLQKKYGIMPSYGYFGIVTRNLLNEKYALN